MATSTPDDAKDRVDLATTDLTGARCLITNVDCPLMVDYAHVLARAKEKEVEMDKLEYAWGVKYRTQSIDTRQNIFRLSAKFHRLFDANKWLLLPDTSIIDQYFNARHSRKIPDIQEKAFSYTLIAHLDMKYVPIHRSEGASGYRKFIYPFEEFPPIVSHVHPRFVICDAADKLRDFADILAFGKGRSGALPKMLAKVGNIYKAWRTAKPGPEFYEGVEPEAQSERVSLNREAKGGVSYAKFFVSTTPPPSRSRDHPSRSEGKIPKDTPGKRVLDDSSIPTEAKVRVDKVALKRCLLENTDESNPLDYAHLLPRSSIDGILTSLEYSWRMDHASLNVDTRWNVFRLNPSLHRMFDPEAWLLLPGKDTINRYHEVKDEPQDFPSLEKECSTYTYTLIAMHDMTNVPIHVQRNKPSAPEDGGTVNDVIGNKESPSDNIDFNLEDAFTAHAFPFHQFPEIRSHVHPRFVICNAGAKLAEGFSIYDFSEGREYLEEDLNKISEIYKTWTKPRLPSDFPAQKTLRRNKPAGDFPDDQTECGRLALPPTQLKRIFPPLDGDGFPKPTKRAKSGGGNDSAWLDDATLGELDQDSSPKKAWKDKMAWIQSWVGQVPLDPTVEVPMDIDLADKLTHHTPDQYPLGSEDMDSLLSA